MFHSLLIEAEEPATVVVSNSFVWMQEVAGQEGRVDHVCITVGVCLY